MNTHAALMILVIALITALLRFLPFLIFPEGKEPPRVIRQLSALLPSAVIGMLVVYCLRNIAPLSGSHGIPELLSVAAVICLHKWKHSSLLSIGAGTVFYMFLIQRVF